MKLQFCHILTDGSFCLVVCAPISSTDIAWCFNSSPIILTWSSPCPIHHDEAPLAEWTNDIDRGRLEEGREGGLWKIDMVSGMENCRLHGMHGACSLQRPYYSIITVCLVCCPCIVVYRVGRKNRCLRLRDPASGHEGEFAQPRTLFWPTLYSRHWIQGHCIVGPSRIWYEVHLILVGIQGSPDNMTPLGICKSVIQTECHINRWFSV